MKNILMIAVVVAIAAAGYVWWHKGQPLEVVDTTPSVATTTVEEQQVSAATMEPGTYEADTSASLVTWQAGKPAIAGYVHTGTFALQSGSVTVTDSGLTGTFVIDMNSLKLVSLGGGKVGQESALEKHLRTSDFFAVEQYPTATFTITGITPEVLPGPAQADYTATGRLTMKGETHDISFPIHIVVAESGQVLAHADLDIDRTTWGINFGSAKFANKITDQLIGDTVHIALDVTLKR